MKPSTTEEFIEACKLVHGDRYGYENSNFIGMNKKLTITCQEHGDFQTTPRTHLNGSQCLKCSGKARLTTEEFIEKARAVHGRRYDYSKVDYQGNGTKVEIICPEHGSFFPKPINHVTNRSGCPACAGCAKVTEAQFLARSLAAHGSRYDYSKANFRTVDEKVSIICPDHGDFQQVAYDHMNGRGCRACGVEKCASTRRWTGKEFIDKATKQFGDALDYSRVSYTNSLTPVEIICPEHGSFFRKPHEHLESTGCPLCSSVAKVSAEEFIARAKEVHGERYSYANASFSSMTTKTKVICKTHGVFDTLPKDHIAKAAGCPQCAREQTASSSERDMAEWIESIGFHIVRNDREALAGFEIDVYLPQQKIGIEFNGAYWHSDANLAHPRIHEVKQSAAEKAGVRLITVWDFDWTNRRPFVQATLKHHLGAAQSTKIDARKCTISAVDRKDASDFYDKHHIQGRAWRQLANYALMLDGRMVACMSFSQGSSRRGKTGNSEWELIRYATDGIVRGGASRLFTAFVREWNPDAVWSFSDRQHFSGNLYKLLGFANDGAVAADYRVYHQASGTIWHKSAWQRRHIPSRLKEIGSLLQFDPETDSRTERDMQSAARCLRIMDAGKVRWKWTRT